MVNELFLTWATGLGVFYGISPANAVYLFSFLISMFLGIVAGVSTQNKGFAFGTFVVFLFIFALMDAFPLWILAVSVFIGGSLYYYLAGRDE